MSILVTGGSGFFARGLVARLLAEYRYERICLYSRNEHAQAAVLDAFDHDSRLRMFVGDVRDRDRLYRAMQGCRHVVHCAALKRIEACHYNPGEAVQTNVHGAMNVIEAARDAGIARVVALSSDKAFEPASVYGHTKAVAEALFLAANTEFEHTKFAVVRYGNVWKSTGSVVPIWSALQAQGAASVPLTDPECTRFFMTLDEAVDLVLNTLKTMKGGELAIPDLPAYRLGDLAEAMGLKTRVIGLGKYEKVHESMGPGRSSDKARRMTVEELRRALGKSV